MPPIDDRTTNRNYQKPNAANTLADDVARLRAALDAIDADIGSGLASGIILENNNVISSSYSIASGKNGVSAGPVTIASGAVVTIPSGSTWVIV